MSYIIVPVYSFACELPDCPELAEFSPANQNEDGENLLDAAHRLLRAEGWEVRGHGGSLMHLCKEHKGAQVSKKPPARKAKCQECRNEYAVREDGRIRNHVVQGTAIRCAGSERRPA